MKLSAKDLLELNIIDEIIPEPLGGAHRDRDMILENIRSSISQNLDFFKQNPIIDKTIVTKGNKGCLFQDTIYPVENVPVKDISGAGDTFLSGLVVEYVNSKNIIKSIEFAQKCTTKVVQKHGVSTV